MTGFIISIIATVICWAGTFIISLIKIKKEIYDIAFNTWYFGSKHDKMTKSRISDINYQEMNSVFTWLWLCWTLSTLWTAVTVILAYQINNIV